jgi:Ni/Co efflux regulator RcnB
MRVRKIAAAIAAASFALSAGAVFAQAERDHEHRGDENRGYDRGHDNRGRDQRGYEHDRYASRDSYRGDEWRRDGRGAGPYHDWYRGSRLPPEYRDRSYVVDDWRAHHLYAPPRGYHWVQAGDDYVLAAIATGVITAVLLNH